MKSIDELRELAADINCNEIIGHVGQSYVSGKVCNTFDGAWLDSWHGAFDRALEAVEREVSENYMLLPVDAAGVPIHLGDKVATAYGDCTPVEITVIRRSKCYGGKVYVGGGRGGGNIDPSNCRHVNPDPLRRLLVDMGEEIWNAANDPYLGGTWDDCGLHGIEDRYAKRIRELIGWRDEDGRE